MKRLSDRYWKWVVTDRHGNVRSELGCQARSFLTLTVPLLVLLALGTAVLIELVR